MRLIMAISADGYVAKGPDDDMRWLGRDDKLAFRLLSTAGSGVCGASQRTCDLMPPALPGRTIIPLSRNGRNLTSFVEQYGADCSLLGGQTLALKAIHFGYVTSVHLCRATEAWAGSGQADRLTNYLKYRQWTVNSVVEVGRTMVETWRE